MKTNHHPFSVLALFCSLGLALAAQAQQLVRYESQPGSKVRIDGTSTMHDWTIEGLIIGGFMEAPAGFENDLTSKTIPMKVEVSIPVRSLKSGKKLMDQVMQEAMKQKEHPKIDYKLKDLVRDESQKAGGPAAYKSKGDLTIAGVTKEIAMPVTVQKADNKIKISGSTNLKMTDFGVKPPAPEIGLGMLKTGDDIKITFEWMTAPQAAKTAAGPEAAPAIRAR